MKKIFPFVLVMALVAMTAYATSYFCCMAPARALEAEKTPELAWLKKEFSLDDASFQKISRLHEDYLPQCRETCAKISAKNAEIREALAIAGSITPEIDKKMAEVAALRLECQKNMLEHFLAVSKTMPQEQGKRYLEWVGATAFGGMQDMMKDSCPACKK